MWPCEGCARCARCPRDGAGGLSRPGATSEGGRLQGDAEVAQVRVILHARVDDRVHDVVEDEVEDPLVRHMLGVQFSAEMGRGECEEQGRGGSWRALRGHSAGGGGRRVGVRAG